MANWGIIGLGNMANKFAQSIQDIKNAKLVAISSTSNLRLNKFGNHFNIEEKYRFKKYDEIINSNDIDSIYISTLNNTHANLIYLCAESKKNILCEKPFAINLNEARTISEKIKNLNSLFYEGIAYRSHPQTKEIIKMINEDEIGEIEKIDSSFGFKVKKVNVKSRLFNKDFGGGAILDLGCYPVSFMYLFSSIDQDLKIINAKGSFANTGVDDFAESELLINNKIIGNAKISFKENLENNCVIYGKKGTISVPSPWLPSKRSFIEVKKGGSYFKKFVESKIDVFGHQIQIVSSYFDKKEITKNDLLIDIDKSLKINNILNTWSKSIL
tara:strand:+ start:737 stop:1720 length:984 start_codon:yes stop_codon:yes gene_type:complete